MMELLRQVISPQTMSLHMMVRQCELQSCSDKANLCLAYKKTVVIFSINYHNSFIDKLIEVSYSNNLFLIFLNNDHFLKVETNP